MISKKKILFFIESLSGGGAEKVLSTIVNHIDKQKFEVTVCVVSAGGKYEEEVANSTRLYCLLKNPDSYHGIEKLWYRLKYHLIYDWLPLSWVYKLFIPQENDVEIAFVEGFATKLLSCSNSKAKKIAWVHCDLRNQPWPIQIGIYKNEKEEKEVYRKYENVVCVSKQVEQVMIGYYGLSNTITIYNPLDTAEILRLAKQPPTMNVDVTKYNIISIGRLERVKGFDMLIPIIYNLREKGADVHLWIVGEGSEEHVLRKMVIDYGMETSVTFTGFLKNPYALMSQMDLFVSSSRAEGFSLVIAEALLLGIPVVSMNCAGPKELITLCGVGTLCDSYRELEKTILERTKMTEHHERSIMKLEVKEVISQIEELLVTR